MQILTSSPFSAQQVAAGSVFEAHIAPAAEDTRSADLRPKRRGQRGATTIVVATSFAAIVGTTALVINVGEILVTHAELETTADLAAKSAAQEMARIYISTGREDPMTDTMSLSELNRIAVAADQRGRKNTAGATAIAVASNDVEVGHWNDATGEFVKSNVGANSVQVTTRRDGATNGELPLFVPYIFGRSSFPLTATAAARISGVRYLPAGVADFPVAISEHWYTTHGSPCSVNNKITFYPTGTQDSCAGWHTFQTDPANGAALKGILVGLKNGTYVSPEIDVGSSRFIFNGGVVASAVNELQSLYDAKKNAAGEMPVLIPVYEGKDCSNPNGWLKIIGVARAVITKVTTGADKLVEARVQCDVIKLAESGGRDYGVLAAGPDLVR